MIHWTWTVLLTHIPEYIYADDTHLTFASNDVAYLEENINDDPTKITEWLSTNKITLNKLKTEFMLIGSRQRWNTFNRLPSFIIDSNSIKQVQFMKSLGVHMDEDLTWNIHIEHISKKIASCIGSWREADLLLLLKCSYAFQMP